jgi:hypothetical protein
VECAIFGVQGKARRRGMVIPFQGVVTQPCAATNCAIHLCSKLTKMAKGYEAKIFGIKGEFEKQAINCRI